jgi:type IV pilus assembly protein PilC
VRAYGDAPTLADLKSRLVTLNKPVIKVFDPPSKRLAERPVTVPLRIKLTFLEQLEACTYLGMDFRMALTICLQTTSTKSPKGRRMAEVICDLREKVSRGIPFSQAIACYPQIFDDVVQGILSAGEDGGTLGESLTNARKIWSRNEELGHRLWMMMIYPAVVFCTTLGVVGILMTKVVPQFLGVMSEMQIELPMPTRLLMVTSQFCSQHPLALTIGSLVGLGLMMRLPAFIRATPALHGVALRLPILGRLSLLLLRANFCRTFAQLKYAGAKTTQALLLCRDLSWNYLYRSAVARSLVRVQAGEALAAALADDEDIFGEMVVNGLTFMEASGADPTGLFRLTGLLERQLDSYITAIRQVLDPVLIVLLGFIVGGIVFATFLPAMEILQKV